MFLPAERARAKERILTFGYFGSGKTHAWTELAEMYRTTETPGTFHVISTEYQAADRALEQYPDIANVSIFECLDWSELTEATAKIKDSAGPLDWLVVDSIGAAWSYVQNDYTQNRWGKDAKRYFGEVQQERGNPEINWSVVNDQYRQWMLPNVLRFPGHVYAASPGEDLRQSGQSGKGGESREVQQLFGRAGLKPQGQKDLGYQLHTILKMESVGKDEFFLTTVDDHAREHLTRAPVVTFPITYLVGVAGWQIS